MKTTEKQREKANEMKTTRRPEDLMRHHGNNVTKRREILGTYKGGAEFQVKERNTTGDSLGGAVHSCC